MECERFIKLIRSWYLQVQDEALAPARMVDFMRAHLTRCPICENDPIVETEVRRIIEIILPPTKAPKAVIRADSEDEDEEAESSAGEDGELASADGELDDVEDDEEDLEEIEDEDEDI